MSSFSPFLGPLLFSVFGEGSVDARLQGRLDASPRTDAYVRDGKLILHVDLPGVSRSTLKVSVNDQWLTVSAERTYAPEPGDSVVLSERPFGKFERRFRLPHSIDGSDVTAELADGVLTISLPAVSRSTDVEVKVSGADDTSAGS